MKNTRLYLIMLFFGVLFLAGCEYTFVQTAEIDEELPTPDPDNPISFATQIIPIFTPRCTDCHDTGGIPPDLTATNAYNSITTLNLVDTADPAASVLYSWVQPATSNHSGRRYSDAQATLLLLWIQEGALNN